MLDLFIVSDLWCFQWYSFSDIVSEEQNVTAFNILHDGISWDEMQDTVQL